MYLIKKYFFGGKHNGKENQKKFVYYFAVLIMLTIVGFSTSLAATAGYYTYEVLNGDAMITDVSTSISGYVILPSKFNGYPVQVSEMMLSIIATVLQVSQSLIR